MTEVTVFFNAACSKCRGTVELLSQRAVSYDLVEYLVAPPNRASLERIVGQLVDPVAQLVRSEDDGFRELGIDPASLDSAPVVIDLLLEHPELMQRPVVVVGGRAIIARPPERIAELL
jgi:arsenate reductase